MAERPAPSPEPSLADRLAEKPLIQAFLERTKTFPNAVAFRHKHLGIWREFTWSQYRDEVERFALGLLELGLRPGDRVAIMGDPVPEWMYADLACQSIGAIAMGIYVTSAPDEVAYLIRNSQARFFVAEDQEYVDKLLQAEERYGPLVERIIVADTRGMFAYTDPRLIRFEAVQDLGRQRRERRPDEWERLVAQRKPDDVIRIFYTSGTTGRPKGSMLT
ncbi:MAG: AMP-binding protein, partial [Clostridia bacterium]|nr:AMP-binding protein [Clostridia bacterium]